MIRNRLCLLLASIVTTAGCSDARPDPGGGPLWGDLLPGSYSVGFRTVELEDSARQRRLRLGIWYPASEDGSQALLLADYLRLLDDDSEAGRVDNALLALQVNSAAPYLVAEAALRELAAAPTAAFSEPTAARGRFPLLLWGLRHSSVLAQSVMSEYLASHGYRVAAVEPLELRPRYPWLEQPTAELSRTIDLWVGDLQASLRHLAPADQPDPPPLGLLAWSYGGISAALLAAADRRVDAMVSFDATGFWTVDQLAHRADWLPSRFRVTLLEMRARRDDMRSLFDLIPATRASRLTFPELSHGNFNAIEGFLPALLGFGPPPPWSRAGEPAREGYQTLARLSRAFLDASLKQVDSWPPPAGESYQLESRAAATPPESEEESIRRVQRGDRNYDPQWLTDVAWRLMDEGRWETSLDLLRRNADHHPASVEARFRLGAGLLRARRLEAARQVLQETLRMSVRHPEASRLLESIRAAEGQ